MDHQTPTFERSRMIGKKTAASAKNIFPAEISKGTIKKPANIREDADIKTPEKDG